MRVSSGGLIFYKNKMLICRPRWDDERWNLPKGIMEEGEDPLEAAIREIQEETNIVVDDNCQISDLGEVRYGKKKKLHLFFIILSEEPEELKCNSFFDRDGKQIPEMVDFKWINPADYSLYFSEKLTESVRKILQRGLESVNWIDKKSSSGNSKNSR